MAFGLEDGTVAVYDNISQNYKTSSFEHKSGVKSVAWKLTPGTNDYTLWSCGCDGINIENMYPLTKHALNVNDEIQRVNKNPASVQVEFRLSADDMLMITSHTLATPHSIGLRSYHPGPWLLWGLCPVPLFFSRVC